MVWKQNCGRSYAAGLKTILVVRRTPDWAQKVPGYYCGPVSEDALDDLARFMASAVARYKDPPYAVKYWELWNEPDVDPQLALPNWPFGCWGDQEGQYYGGGYYAKMLKVVYPAIKAADPEAQVLIGGLLLERDPAEDTRPHPPGLFLEGILRAGGGDYFDAVSFHGYVHYDGQVREWEKLGGTWLGRGGAVAGKANFLRELLARYGLRSHSCSVRRASCAQDALRRRPADFLAAQAAYLPRVYAQSLALDLVATLWYTLDWPGSRGGQAPGRRTAAKAGLSGVTGSRQIPDRRTLSTSDYRVWRAGRLCLGAGRARALGAVVKKPDTGQIHTSRRGAAGLRHTGCPHSTCRRAVGSRL